MMVRWMALLHLCLMSQFGISQVINKPLVVASASMIADMAKNIGGEYVKVEMIVTVGGDPHLHEPTPEDARLVSSADLILINGLTFEGWINKLIENSGTSAKTEIVTKGISVLDNKDYKNSVDPHAWMDASNGVIYANNIKNALVQLDPDHQEAYEKNYNRYVTLLNALHQRIKDDINTIPKERRVLITSHDAFQYYGRAYGIQLEAIMGISTEAEAQTSDIIRVNQIIRAHNIPAIFIESTINPKLIQQIAHDNKINIGGKLYADSLGDKDSPASSYIDMLTYNTRTIVDALRTPSSASTIDKPENPSKLWILGAIMLAGFALIIYRRNG